MVSLCEKRVLSENEVIALEWSIERVCGDTVDWNIEMSMYDAEDCPERYDAARSLPNQAMSQWLDSVASAASGSCIKKILDVGSGTGRFSEALGKKFQCEVIAVEPSEAMLDKARQKPDESVLWEAGRAEDIPADDRAVDLVWMSQVYHHLNDRVKALNEIRRVLTPRGHVVIRNTTMEDYKTVLWLDCFPEAIEFNRKRMPSQNDLINLICSSGFTLRHKESIQTFVSPSYRKYVSKIGQRGSSSLLGISDGAFEAGLQRLKQWVDALSDEKPVYEPVDLFVFQMD